MDTPPLVGRISIGQSDIEEGHRLVRALDADGARLTAALWYREPELGVWRLLLSTDLADTEGPQAAYARVRRVIQGTSSGVTMEDLHIVGSDDPLVAELRSRGFAVGGGGTVSFSRPMGETQQTVIYRLL